MNCPFNEAKYNALLEGREISEIYLSQVLNENEDFRIDSSYYKKDYLKIHENLSKFIVREIGEFSFVSDGDHSKFPENQKPEIRYLQARNIKNNFLNLDNEVFISKAYFDKNRRSHITEENILLSIMGSVGDITITPKGFKPSLANRAVAIIKNIKEFNPYFVFSYLLSSEANLLIERLKTGGVQERINLDVLRKVKIPSLRNQLQQMIENIVVNAHSLYSESKDKYKQCESFLLNSVGLKDFEPTEEKTNIKSFSESFLSTGRIDAEFYQKKYDYAYRKLNELNPIQIVPLENLLETITNGQTPLHHDLSQGEVVFLTAEHVFDFRIDYDSDKRVLLEHHEEKLSKTAIKSNDLLITIKGKIGNAAVVEDVSQPTNINQDVGLLKLKKGFNPYYVAGFINSAIGKMFAEQLSTGQINPFLGLGNLRTIPIPIFDDANEIGNQIRKKVVEAEAIKSKSKHFLEIAKRAVEIAIEETEEKAIEFINEETK